MQAEMSNMSKCLDYFGKLEDDKIESSSLSEIIEAGINASENDDFISDNLG